MNNVGEKRKSTLGRRKIFMIIAGILLIIIGTLIIYWNIPYSPFRKSFDRDMQTRLEGIETNGNVCTKEEIDRLPEKLRKHCEYIGLTGSKKYNAVNVLFHDTKFVFDSSKGTTLDMDYDLWLMCDRPFRSAYCSSSMAGIPFDGIDYCTDKKTGGMRGILGKMITIFDVSNEQMYKAGLISWLAEGVCVNPSVILSDHITYKEIDSNHIKATVSYDGVEGTGIFAFDEQGRLESFYSDERQVEEIDGVMTPIGWRAEYREYADRDGLKIPKIMKAVKVFSDKEIVYFNSDDFEINYYR